MRTHVTEPPTKGDKPPSASPYPPGSSFFFKVKFDEPYMMYRDWREVTKTLLSKGPSTTNLSKAKMRRPETQVYVKWVIGEIKRDRSQFAEFNKGRGIIATRERFLKWLESSEGKDQLDGTSKEDEVKTVEANKKFGKTVIVPVAVPGVGAYPCIYRCRSENSWKEQARLPSLSRSRTSLGSVTPKATTSLEGSLALSSSRASSSFWKSMTS